MSNLPDYTCDQSVKVTFIGDSIVHGTGDTKNNGKGGYPLRLQQRFGADAISSIGVPGVTSSQMLSRIRRIFNKPVRNAREYNSIINADVIIFDLGRNDYWDGAPPSKTARQVERIRKLIQKSVKSLGLTPPFTVTGVLTIPKRDFQAPWVRALDQEFLRNGNKQHPADLRFDLFGNDILGSDNLHPTSRGYNILAKKIATYLRRTLPRDILKVLKDRDKDGVYDRYEAQTFGTDPKKSDSDADGVSDKDELFINGTDPLDPLSF